MPFKHHAELRHHIPKPRHRVTNWPEYDAAPRRRGSLTVWITDEATAAWRAAPRTTPGGQPSYSALAITMALTLRVVFRLALRQTEGLIGVLSQFLVRDGRTMIGCNGSRWTAGNDRVQGQGSRFEREVILWGVRWYVAYPISYRQLEEMMGERGVEIDHSTLNRWVPKYVPLLDKQFRARKRPAGPSWRMDETYIKVKGTWKYLYRAVDKAGAAVDFLLTAKRDREAALRFLRKAIRYNGTPEKITIDKSGANTAAIDSHNNECEAGIEMRQIKYLNNIVEQDHRTIKRQTRPILGFKSPWSAAVTLVRIELMHMIRKGQLLLTGELCPARQFYSLAE